MASAGLVPLEGYLLFTSLSRSRRSVLDSKSNLSFVLQYQVSTDQLMITVFEANCPFKLMITLHILNLSPLFTSKCTQALVDPLMLPVVIPVMNFLGYFLPPFLGNKPSGAEATVISPPSSDKGLSVLEPNVK